MGERLKLLVMAPPGDIHVPDPFMGHIVSLKCHGILLFFQDPNEKKSCRTDWFQTAPSVNISVFAKVAVPDESYIEVNRVICKMHIVFEGGKSLFEETLVLRNVRLLLLCILNYNLW